VRLSALNIAERTRASSELYSLFPVRCGRIGGNLRWTNGLPLHLKASLVAEKSPLNSVGYVDLDLELPFRIVIPLAHLSGSRKQLRESEGD